MGAYQIWESVGGGSQRVRDYEDIERHHPTRGIERGRIYGTVNGEREELLKMQGAAVQSRDGDYYVSKDFVLISGNNRVSVPSMANGYIGRVDPANGVVQIFDKPANDPSREMIAQYRHLDLRNSRLQVGDQVVYGQPLGIQGGFGGGNPTAYPRHVHIDVNSSYLPTMDRYIRDMDSGRITTDTYPRNVENLTSAATVGNLTTRERLIYPDGARQQDAPNTEAPNPQRPNQPRPSADHDALADGVLRQGESGKDVEGLQKSLNRLGITDASGRPLREDGDYGRRTSEAIENFQRANGLKVDGIAGPRTLEALGRQLPDGTVTVERAEVTGLAPTPSTAPLISDAAHPRNALYAAIARQLPPGTRPEAIANVTMQAMENGMTEPSRIGRVGMANNGDVIVSPAGSMGGDWIRVDLSAPTATLRQMSDHMAAQASQPQERTPAPEPTRPRTAPEILQ